MPLAATAVKMPAKFRGKCLCGAAVQPGAQMAYDRVQKKVVGCAACDFGEAVSAAAAPVVSSIDLPAAVQTALARLTDEQLEIGTKYAGGITRLLATAGSGKTYSLAVAVGRLLREGASPSSILVTSFTNKAAGEIKERLLKLFGAAASEVLVGTFHSLTRGWLVEHFRGSDAATVRRLNNPIDGNGRVDIERYDVSEQASVPKTLRTLAARLLGSESLQPWLPGEQGIGIERDPSDATVDDYLRAVGILRAYLVQPADTAGIEAHFSRAKLRELPQFYMLLDRSCRELGVSTFDEWLFTAATLASDPTTGFAVRIGSRLRYLIVDECTDNNKAQLVLAVAIALAGHGNLLLCGDIRQSCYKFRGAVPEFTANLDEHVGGRAVVTKFLSGNFRSVAPIVELGNRIADGRSWNFGPPARAVAPDADVPVEAALSVWRPGDGQEEAAEAAALCKEELAALAPLGSNAAGKPIAVLARTNGGLGPVEVALLRQRLPYTVTRGCGFFGRREVRAALAYLKLAHSAADEETIRVAASTPPRRLGRKFVQAVSERMARGVGIVSALKSAGSAFSRWADSAEDLARNIEAVKAETDIGAATKCAVEVVRSAFEGKLEGEADNARIENLTVLVEIAAGFGSVAELLDYAEQGARAKDVDSVVAPSVTLSTVHSAKGLEWRTVVVVGAIAGTFPHSKAATEAELEEEARLEYIASTRAAKRLVLSAPMLDRKGKEAQPALCVLIAQSMLRQDADDSGDGTQDVGTEPPSPVATTETRSANECGEPASPPAPPPSAVDWNAAERIAELREHTDERAGARYVVVTRKAFDELMGELGFALDPARSARHGQIVYALPLPNGAWLLVYSTIPNGTAEARELGEDSIRVAAVFEHDGKSRAVLPKEPWVARTVGWRRNLIERIRGVWDEVVVLPRCDFCGALMAKRTHKTTGSSFYGCSAFPACKNTKNGERVARL